MRVKLSLKRHAIVITLHSIVVIIATQATPSISAFAIRNSFQFMLLYFNISEVKAVPYELGVIIYGKNGILKKLNY